MKSYHRLFLLGIILFFIHSIEAWCDSTIIVTWHPNKESDLAGYKVYYGRAFRYFEHWIDVGMTTEYTMSALQDTGLFYFAVTAYDSTGNESRLSNVVSIHIDGEVSGKGGFQLLSNYPNPMNPITRIPYSLSQRRFVTITMYDILGKEVKRLVEEEKEAGAYAVEWDGMSENGIPVANGVYFCRMIVGNFSRTKKMTLLR